MLRNRYRLSSLFVAGLFLILAALACNAPTPTAPPLISGTPPPSGATATAPKPDAELVTPASPIAITTVNSNIRSGPGTNYALLATVATDLPLRLTGRNADRSWLQIEFPAGLDGRAWIFAENVSVYPGVNVGALPVVSAPPAPPTAQHTPTAIPAVTATSQRPAATATRQPPTATATSKPAALDVLRADKLRLSQGECTMLRWDVDNVKAVFLNAGHGEEAAVGHGTRWICPDVTTIYSLQVVHNDDTSQYHMLTVMVSGACGDQPIISRFEASATQIKPGERVAFVWDVACAQAVFFRAGADKRQPVGGHDHIEVQPNHTTLYRLVVVAKDGSEIKTDITITVAP